MDKDIFVNFCDRMGIHVSGNTFKTYADYICGFTSIFHLKDVESEIKAKGIYPSGYQELCRDIELHRKTTLGNLIFAMCIPGIGKSDAEKIADAFLGRSGFFKSAILDGFKTVKLPDYPKFSDSFKDVEYREDVLCLLDELEIQDTIFSSVPISSSAAARPMPLSGLNFVVTGTLKNYTRAEIEAEINRYGGHFQRVITRLTNFVLCGEKPGATKFNKARQQGIPVIYENDFLKMIGKL